MTREAHRRTAVRLRNLLAVAGVLASLGLLTACSDSDDSAKPEGRSTTDTPSTPAASPTRTPSESADPAAKEKAAVLTAYRSYWDEKTAAYAKASAQGTHLKRYAVAEAYKDAETELKAMKSKGIVATGKPAISPKASTPELNRKTPRGTVTDCVDVSKWKLVKKSSGQEVALPEEALTKYVARVTVEKWYGHWRILKFTPEGKC
ncbi:hypothetical protein [Streptomyces aureoverticillatus]|uniref:hypothetical protein n=1 Tax=Streptomyces aureoverticillatus TaxID=66871 RepID=UPI0013DA35A9|nr:hypothetical protein [Streptomyces aureoverticillatus]QIB49545.1 hypothetical protein G3H79_40980 [Streptomyces aureoverticillatus]